MLCYLVLYYGGVPFPDNDTGRNRARIAWDKWRQEIGNSLTDPGGPTIDAQKVTSETIGAVGDDAVTGYCVLEASNLAEATELVKSAPILGEGGRVAVYQVLRR